MKHSPIVVVLSGLLMANSVLAQQGTPERQEITGVQPVVDGSQHPELVPDDAALRVLFISIAEPPNASPDQLQRMRNKVSRMQLSEADMKVLVKALGAFHATKTAHEAVLKNLYTRAASGDRAATGASMLAAQNAITALATDTYNSLLSQLSSDGANKLRSHVAYVKTRIRIVPPPTMKHPSARRE